MVEEHQVVDSEPVDNEWYEEIEMFAESRSENSEDEEFQDG
jgi:hypothetical protein